RFFRGYDAVGFDIENQLVEVGALFNTGAFNRIADTTHRAVRCIQHDTANGVGAVIRQGTDVAGHIATTLFNLDLHFKLTGVGQVCNDVIRINDFNVVWQLDIAGQHNTSALLAQHQGDFFAVMQLENHAFQVQQNVDD